MDDFWNAASVAIISSVAVGGFTLVGILMSTRASLKAISQQFDLKGEAEHRQILRSRGEELYQVAATWTNYLFFQNVLLIKVMQDEISYNEHLDLIINSDKSIDSNIERLDMLIDVYFPVVREEYEAVLEARDYLNNIIYEHKTAYKIGGNGIHFLKPFQDALMKIEQRAERLKLSISSELKSI